MLIEEQGVRILIDPGNYSTGQKDVRDVDVILITHEHTDHIDLESFSIVLENNPNARIFTNNGVGKKLDEKGIKFELLTDGKVVNINDVAIESVGKLHAVIHKSIPVIENTGYLIANRLFYPGDAFTMPNKRVEILALPVSGPWMKISEAIEYARKVKPKICFPVHDGMMMHDRRASTRKVPEQVLSKEGIEFVEILEGEEMEF